MGWDRLHGDQLLFVVEKTASTSQIVVIFMNHDKLIIIYWYVYDINCKEIYSTLQHKIYTGWTSIILGDPNSILITSQ